MKKTFKFGFSFIIVAALLLTATGAAIAAPLGDGPVVTPLTGSATFTAVTLNTADLPGTIINDAGTVLPAGFNEGEKAFDGDGIQVSGMQGSASACFPLAKYQYGWDGSVYQWANGKWTVLPTTITPSAEGSTAACATLFADGTYALIVEYHAPANDTKEKACNFIEISALLDSITNDAQVPLKGFLFAGNFDIAKFPTGLIVKYKIINITPAGSVSGDLAGTTVVAGAAVEDGMSYALVLFDEGAAITSAEGVIPTITFRFYFPGCYYDYDYEFFNK